MNYEQDSLSQWHFRHDALEAFNSFSAARNLFFWTTVIGLFIIQGIFWAVDRGAIDPAIDNAVPSQTELQNATPAGPANTHSISKGFVICKNNPQFSFCQEQVAPESTDQPNKSIETEPAPSQKAHKPALSNENAATIKSILHKTIEITRLLVIFFLVLYIVCLFLCIQLTLTGSLGGMSISTNAFFVALIAAMFILPWQKSIISGMPTALFSFQEILDSYAAKSDTSSIAYYGRFIVIWGISVILLIVSQWRSCQAVKQITARAKEWKSVNPIAQQVVPVQQAPIPLAAQTGAPIAAPQQPQNPNDTGFGSSPIPVE